MSIDDDSGFGSLSPVADSNVESSSNKPRIVALSKGVFGLQMMEEELQPKCAIAASNNDSDTEHHLSDSEISKGILGSIEREPEYQVEYAHGNSKVSVLPILQSESFTILKDIDEYDSEDTNTVPVDSLMMLPFHPHHFGECNNDSNISLSKFDTKLGEEHQDIMLKAAVVPVQCSISNTETSDIVCQRWEDGKLQVEYEPKNNHGAPYTVASSGNEGSTLCTFTMPHNVPTISKYFECTNNDIASVPFIGEVEILVCDSCGCEYWNSDHDITIRIPPGAIPAGLTLHIEVAVALYGPFQFPSGSHPISPILWLCVQEDITPAFRKPFQIILPHFIVFLQNGQANIKNPGIIFTKADHRKHSTNESEMKQYVFSQLDTAFVCVKEGIQNYGILSTDHCCFFCITANDSFYPELALNAGYCFWCIEKPLVSSRDTIFLCTTFFLKTCVTV